MNISNRDLWSQELFQQFGNVVDVRIQGKGIRVQNGGGRAPAPYYGFVVFDAPEAAEAALNKKVMGVLLFSSMLK